MVELKKNAKITYLCFIYVRIQKTLKLFDK